MCVYITSNAGKVTIYPSKILKHAFVHGERPQKTTSSNPVNLTTFPCSTLLHCHTSLIYRLDHNNLTIILLTLERVYLTSDWHQKYYCRLHLTWLCIFVFFFPVENGEHCDFTVLRNMLIRWRAMLQSRKITVIAHLLSSSWTYLYLNPSLS